MGLFDFLGFGGQPSPPNGGGGDGSSSPAAPAANPIPVAPPSGGGLLGGLLGGGGGGDPNAVDPQTGFRMGDLQAAHSQQLQNFGLMLMAASARMSSAQRAQMLGQAAGAFGDTTGTINQMVGARYNQHLMSQAQQKQAALAAVQKKLAAMPQGDGDGQLNAYTALRAQVDPAGTVADLSKHAEATTDMEDKVNALTTRFGVPKDQALRLVLGGGKQVIGDAINGYATYDTLTGQLVPLGTIGPGGGLAGRMTQGLTPPPGADGGGVPAPAAPGPAMPAPSAPVQAGAVPAPAPADPRLKPGVRVIQVPGVNAPMANGSAPSNIMPNGVPANLAPAFGPGAALSYHITNPATSFMGNNPTKEDLDRQSAIGFTQQMNNEVMSALATDITGTKTNAARELARDPLPEPASVGTNAAMALHRYDGVVRLVQQQMGDVWNTLQRSTSIGDKATAEKAAEKYQELQRAQQHLTTSMDVLRQNLNGRTGLPNPAADAAAAAAMGPPGQPGQAQSGNPLAASARQYLGR